MKYLTALSICLTFLAANVSAESHKFPDWKAYGYKVTHHMGAMVQHLEEFGFNKFDHPPMPDHRFFVITPALDHFYSKAIVDTRWGPVMVDTPARDDRYASLLVTDMEHFGIYAEVTNQGGQRFVVVHEDFKGPLPKGTVIRTKSDFPLIFLRTQTFAFNDDKLSNNIRSHAKIHGAWQEVDLPNEKDPQAIIKWTMKHSKRYPQTEALMNKAAQSYTAETHKETFNYIYKFLQTGQVTGSTGMFDTVDSPTGANHIVRAAGTLLGHLGFPTHHAYYQNTPVDRKGRILDGKNGPFVLTVKHDPGMDLFWSITRYGNKSRLPLNPADIGGKNIQAYNGFNTRPDKDGNVTITFSRKDPQDGTYWMPVTDDYYFIARYYGPNEKLNGNTVHDVLFKGTPLAKNFKATQFTNKPQQKQRDAKSSMSSKSGKIKNASADTILSVKKPVKKASRSLEGTIKTRVGQLEFSKGYPTDRTVKKLYNEMDFQRGVQAYLWGLPMVEMAEWQKAQKDVFKAGSNDFVTYLNFTQKLGILTANATTPYMIAFPNLKETGPMVFEIPAGPTAGGLLDFWQRPFSDLGQTGPDKGKGAKYLILGPGHPEMKPAGYIVVRSPHWNVFLGHRVLHPDPATSMKLMKSHKLYPYSQRENPKPTRFISSKGIDWEAYQPRGLTYFARLASILEIEPVEPRDYMIMAMLRPLGIKPGVKFNPNKRQTAILSEAAVVGEAMARANSYAKRFEGARIWEGKHWEKALFITDTDQDLETHTQLDERASWFYEAIGVTDGMMGKIVGAGQEYLEAQKDSDGDWLDGGKAYKLTIPANAPVKQFWSVTIYDNDDRCLIDTGSLPDKSSRMDLAKNQDGSVTLYFGPTPPAKAELQKNWVKTVPGEGWFTYFRLYAPTQPYFDRKWQLNDFEKVK